jgi:hypothetical protein
VTGSRSVLPLEFFSSAHPHLLASRLFVRCHLCQVVRDVQLQKLEWFETLSSHLLEGAELSPVPLHTLTLVAVYLPKSTKARWKQAVDETESAEAYDEVVTAEFTDYDEYIEFHGQIRSVLLFSFSPLPLLTGLACIVATVGRNSTPFAILLLLPPQLLQESFFFRKLKSLHRYHNLFCRCICNSCDLILLLLSVQREGELMRSLSSVGAVPHDHPLRSNLEDCVLQWEGLAL